MTLTRDQIFAKRAELPREVVSVPELGGDVLIRVLTLKEVGEIQRAQRKDDDPMKIYPRMVALSCINEDGSPLFVGEDVALLDGLPFTAVEVIALAVVRINKIGADDTARNGEAAPKA